MATKAPATGPAADLPQGTNTAGDGPAPERQPMPEPAGGWPADEFTGKFGHYVRDPFTGIRSVAPDAA